MATSSQRRREASNAYRRSRPVANTAESLAMESQSMVEICGRHWTKCGYCKPNTKTSLSYGLLTKRLTCADYQELIDRGWRRSGTFVYKPVMHETCCPQYTIRLDVSQFKPTKGQRHVLNRVKRYLNNEVAGAETALQDSQQEQQQQREVDTNRNRRQPRPDQTVSGMPKGGKKLMETSKNGLTHGGNGHNSSTTTSSASSTSSGSNSDSSTANVSPPPGTRRQPSYSNNKGKRKGKGQQGKAKVGGGGDAEQLVGLSQKVARAAALAVREKAEALDGLELEEGWEGNLQKWSQVRPIRSKTCQVSGGGFSSTVALSIASAARKRGWKATGDCGGAVGIAEAVAELLIKGEGQLGNEGANGARRVGVSDVSVAPNGFINFAADALEASSATGILSRVHPESSSSQPRIASGSGNRRPAPESSLQNQAVGDGGTNAMDIVPGSERHQCGDSRHATSQSFPRSGVPKISGDMASTGDESARGVASGGAATAERAVSSSVDGAEAGNARSSKAGSREKFTPSPQPFKAKYTKTAGEGVGVKDMDVGVGSFPEVAAAAAAAGMGGGAAADVGPSGAVGSGNSSSGLSSLPQLDPSVESHKLTVSTVPARLTEEVFDLYRKYQITVHGDHPAEVTSDQFRRFLVDSPLIRQSGIRSSAASRRYGNVGGASPARRRGSSMDVTEGEEESELAEVTEGRDSLSVPCGSYHQLYRIDGRLVAVGVVDILPKCLSSVYCFYDPDYRALALGKLTAIKETEFVREASQLRNALRDYYMGYYIHTCPKMSYKGSYSPSFLLCPERLTWVPLDLCRPVLDRQKYARLSDLLPPPPPANLETFADFALLSQRGSARTSNDDRGGIANADHLHGRRHPDDSGIISSDGPRGEGAGDVSGKSGSVCGGSSTSRRRKSPLSPAVPVLAPPPSKRTGGREMRDGSGAGGEGAGSGEAGSCSGSPMDVFGTDALEMPTQEYWDNDSTASKAAAEMEAAAYRKAAAAREAAIADEASGMHDIPLLLGLHSYPVTFRALTAHSQAMLRDVLRMYAAALGPHLTRTVILKLHD